MRKVKQNEIRRLVEIGAATDVTRCDIPNPKGRFEVVMWSQGIYGANGVVVKDTGDGKLYAVTSRSSNLFQLL